MTFMFSAGETSGDLLAAELVAALRSAVGRQGAPAFFGAGGPAMAAAGVELAFDMTEHAVIGLWDVLTNLGKFRRLMRQLVELALARRPDVLVCVDFSAFHRRLAAAIRARQHEAPGWSPRIVQFVSPQVWASRPGRAVKMAKDFDLVLSIFPFEKAWYAEHAPQLRVEFVGHPMIDRHGGRMAQREARLGPTTGATPDEILLLPGSRRSELQRHLPVMLTATRLIAASRPARFRMVLPSESLRDLAQQRCERLACSSSGAAPEIRLQIGDLAGALQEATLAIASTGTVTMECAFFGVPAVTLYRTNLLTYEIGRRIVTVKSLTMPNLLAGATVYPEFIQHEATPERLAAAVTELLKSPERRAEIRRQLAAVIRSLGEPGACRRAAGHILDLLSPPRAFQFQT